MDLVIVRGGGGEVDGEDLRPRSRDGRAGERFLRE